MCTVCIMYFFQNNTHSTASQYSNDSKNTSLLYLSSSLLLPSVNEWLLNTCTRLACQRFPYNVAALDIYKKKKKKRESHDVFRNSNESSVRDTRYTPNVFVRFHFTVRDNCKKLLSDCFLFSSVKRRGMIWQHRNVKV